MTENNTNNQRRPSLVWPLVLIGFGVMLLLGNMGVIKDDVWLIAYRMWPLLLIALGLDVLMGRRGGVWPAITTALILGVFAAGAWLVNWSEVGLNANIVTQSIRQPIGDAEDATISIDFAVGELILGANTNSSDLALGTVGLFDVDSFQEDFKMVGSTAYYELKSHSQDINLGWPIRLRGKQETPVWQIDLTTSIPLDIEINTGVGEATLNLSDLTISNLDVSVGVGKTILDLPNQGQFEARISGGIGLLIINIPAGMEARLRVSTGLGNTQIVGDFISRNGVRTTPGFDDADNWVDLFVSGGIGEIRIVQEN